MASVQLQHVTNHGITVGYLHVLICLLDKVHVVEGMSRAEI